MKRRKIKFETDEEDLEEESEDEEEPEDEEEEEEENEDDVEEDEEMEEPIKVRGKKKNTKPFKERFDLVRQPAVTAIRDNQEDKVVQFDIENEIVEIKNMLDKIIRGSGF